MGQRTVQQAALKSSTLFEQRKLCVLHGIAVDLDPLEQTVSRQPPQPAGILYFNTGSLSSYSVNEYKKFKLL